MPFSIRSRLLFLVACCVLPALAGALWLVVRTADAEREAHERTLRETARAMSLVVERELAQRATIAQLLARSPLLDRAPALDDQTAAAFAQQAREAMRGLQGSVELSARTDLQGVGALQPGADGTLRAAAVMPVERGGVRIASVVVTLLPAELQRVVDARQFPGDWYAAVIDSQRRLVARAPGGAGYAGRQVSQDLRPQMEALREGLVDVTTLEGEPVVGYFSTLSQGWSFIVSMPRAQFNGYVGANVMRVVAGAALLLALALAGALWVARGIVTCVISLKRAAARMQAGQPVALYATGITECDDVAAAMTEAAETLQHARTDLERQVAEAVERTRAAEQRASHSQRVDALGRLTGGVAHDFNNLLGVISNSAHLIERHAGHNPELKVPVAATLRAVEVGSRLTQHLVRFAGRRPVRPQALDLARALPDLEEMLRSVLGHRIQVSVDVAPGTAPVTVDSSELELALMNLALNARDAMPRGGTVRLSARNADAAAETDNDMLAGLAPRGYVLIAVSDDGSGIDASLTERVFEPFFTTKGVGHGTGLGLAQVHGFCSQAGGAARLATQSGSGTTVTLVLPASDAAVGTAPPPAAAPSAALPQLNGAHVLLVEDNEELGNISAALLEANGARVLRARDAGQALERAQAGEAIDIVLSDVVMPGPLDGIGLARALRARRPSLPVLLISGYSSALAEVSDFTVLHKPCAPEELLAALSAALAKHDAGMRSAP